MISRSFAGGQNEYQQKCQRTRPRDNFQTTIVPLTSEVLLVVKMTTNLLMNGRCQRTCPLGTPESVNVPVPLALLVGIHFDHKATHE